jgi:hypothetical protein
LLRYLKLMKTYVDGTVQKQVRAPLMIVVNRENEKLCNYSDYFGLKILFCAKDLLVLLLCIFICVGALV